jgi:enoyl-CoA hydratase/carnithine racemase
MTAAPASGETRITREVRGHVFLIGFNRPAKKNAFDVPMLHELAAAFTELDRNPELRCGLVFAHGAAFTAGLDLANVAPAFAGGKFPVPEGAVDPMATHGPRVSKPVVVAVHGLCLTIGVELMLACDIRVAAEGARFGQIEVRRGIFPFGGGCARWVSTCGWGNAMRYLLTGDELDAQEALRIGLVQEVVPPERVLPRALELAEKVAAQAPLAVQATLRNARVAHEGGAALAAKELMAEALRLFATEDALEGMRSFLERRAGNFAGR